MLLRESVMTLLLLSLAACGSDRIKAPEASYFRAALQGAVEAEYEGEGTFSVGTLPWGGKTFQIFSEHERENILQTFSVRRFDGPPLPPGKYPLTLVHGISKTSHGLGAQYWRRSEVQKMFAADAGELVISLSTPESMAGTFAFEGFQYCVRDPETLQTIEGPCRVPDATPESAPRITVTGSFHVTRKNVDLVTD